MGGEETKCYELTFHTLYLPALLTKFFLQALVSFLGCCSMRNGSQDNAQSYPQVSNWDVESFHFDCLADTNKTPMRDSSQLLCY